MSGEEKERILEAVCDICHWPYVYRDDEVMHAEKCDHCPIEALLNGTAADVRPVHGKWCLDSEYEYIECSLCGGAFYTGADSTNEAKRFMENGYAPNYCPSCGADMRPKEET